MGGVGWGGAGGSDGHVGLQGLQWRDTLVLLTFTGCPFGPCEWHAYMHRHWPAGGRAVTGGRAGSIRRT